MALKNLMIRSVDSNLWSRARLKALKQGLSMGQVVNGLLRLWLVGKVQIKGKD